MSRITEAAYMRDCTIRLPSCCCFDPETTVFCHFRLNGISGMGYKTEAPVGAFGCFKCHQKVDSDKSDAVQLAFAKGCLRTIEILWREGIIK